MPSRGFSAGLMLASLFAGLVLGLLGPSQGFRAIAWAAVAAVWIAGWLVITRRRPAAFPAVAVASLAILGLFANHVANQGPPYPLRALHVAAILSYAALATAGVLWLLNVLDAGRGLLLGFSVAFALFVAEALVPESTPPQVTEWRVSIDSDPQVGFRYRPNSTGTNYYPDNPRGYFERTDPLSASWSVETHEGSEAMLDVSGTEPGHVRVTPKKLTGDAAWYVKLRQSPFAIAANNRYVLAFRARADAERDIGGGVGRNGPPWDTLSSYAQFKVQTDWRPFELPFVARESEPAARLFFDLGSNDAGVEFADVVLADLTAGRDVKPDTAATEFFVSYRFNALGFRGPDYVIPRPPGTFRILALGDSYTLGVGVHEPDTFEVQLEERLNSRTGPRYEVINAGVSGYGTREERLSYELFASQYTPQIVLLVMVFNDDLSYAEEVRGGYVSTTARPPGLFDLWRRFEAARTQRPYDYTQAMREVLELNEACRLRDARLAVVVFRNSPYYEPWLKLIKAANDALQGTGIPVLDLGPALVAESSKGRDLTVHAVDGHPNEIAHRIAAEEIERFLEDRAMLEP